MNLIGLVAVLMMCTTAVIISILLLRYWTIKSTNTTSLEQTKLQYQFLIEEARPTPILLPPAEDRTVEVAALRALQQATENLGRLNDEARYMYRKGTGKMMPRLYPRAEARWMPPTIGVSSFDKADLNFLMDDPGDHHLL